MTVGNTCRDAQPESTNTRVNRYRVCGCRVLGFEAQIDSARLGAWSTFSVGKWYAEKCAHNRVRCSWNVLKITQDSVKNHCSNASEISKECSPELLATVLLHRDTPSADKWVNRTC